MIRNLKILAIIFSVVLNIAFIGSYFYHRAELMPLTGHQGKNTCFLYEELDLSREQLDRIEPLRNSFHAFVNEQGRKIKAAQLELVGLLAREKPDRRMIAAKQEEIRALLRPMQAKVIEHLLEESRIFTPEQRERFFSLIRGRIANSNGPRPSWMPQTQKGPSK